MFKEHVDGAPLSPCDHPQGARRVVTPNASHTQEMPARGLPTPARLRSYEYCDQCERFLDEVTPRTQEEE